jgi:hypothetical protein
VKSEAGEFYETCRTVFILGKKSINVTGHLREDFCPFLGTSPIFSGLSIVEKHNIIFFILGKIEKSFVVFFIVFP